MREDAILEEEDFRGRGPPRPLPSPPVGIIRMREDGILEDEFDPRNPPGLNRRIPVPMPYQDIKDSMGMSAAEIEFQEIRHTTNKGNNNEGFTDSEIGFQGNRYDEDGFQDNYYKGKRKWINEDDGYQQNRYKGKRWNSNAGSSQYNKEHHSMKRTGQKSSALGRIQSGISVWSRIEEKRPSPSMPQVNDFSHLDFLDENQPEIDSLDLSYKSNALVAKVMVPSIPDQQLNNEGQSLRTVMPKDRLKMKKVGQDREQVIIPLVCSSIGPKKLKDKMKKKMVEEDREQVVIPIICSSTRSKKPASVSFQVSKGLDAMKVEKGSPNKPVNDGSKEECSLSAKFASDAGKPADDGSKKAIDSSSKLASDVSKKAIRSSIEPAHDGSEKGISSSREPASDASKKVMSSSSKPVVRTNSQPSSKKVTKVASIKKIAAKRTVKPVEKNISKDHKQEVKASVSRSTNCDSSKVFLPEPSALTTSIGNSSREQSSKDVTNCGTSQILPPGPSTLTTSIGNSSLEQSSKDASFVYWPMEVAPPLEGSPIGQSSKIDASVYMPMAVTTPTRNSLADQSSENMSLLQGAMAKNIAAEHFMNDANTVQALMVGTSSSGKNPMAQSSSDVNAVQHAMVATSLNENGASWRSRNNINLVQDNLVSDAVKEETMTLLEEVAQELMSAYATRTVIDISSDSSSEEGNAVSSPSKAICPIKNVDADCSSKERDIERPSEGFDMSFLKQSSPREIIGDARVMHQVATSVGTVISSSHFGSPKDDNGKRKGKQIDGHHTLEVSSVRDKIEIFGKETKENNKVFLPSDASMLVQDLNPLSVATDKEENDQMLSGRALPMTDSIEILEYSAENAVMSTSTEQTLPSRASQKSSLVGTPRAPHASTCMTERQSKSQFSDSKYHENTHKTNKPDGKIINGGSSLVSNRLLTSEAELKKKSEKAMQQHHPVSVKTQFVQSYEHKKLLSADVKLTEGVPPSRKSVSDQRAFPNQLSSSGSLKEPARASRVMRNKTWHQTDTRPAALHLHGNLTSLGGLYKQSAKKQSPKKLGRVLNASYVRKGNSLIRKPVNAVHPPILPYGFDSSSRKKLSMEKTTSSASADNISNHKSYSNPSLERPSTPPLSLCSKLPGCTVDSSKECPQPITEDHVPEPDMPAEAKPAEDQAYDLLCGSVDDQNMETGFKAETLTRKRMIYVKRKSNQLVAAPPSSLGDSSVRPTEQAEKQSSSTTSDLYYMRTKNQLILSALLPDNQQKHDGITPSNSGDQGASSVFSLRGSRRGLFNKRLDEGLHFSAYCIYSFWYKSWVHVIHLLFHCCSLPCIRPPSLNVSYFNLLPAYSHMLCIYSPKNQNNNNKQVKEREKDQQERTLQPPPLL